MRAWIVAFTALAMRERIISEIQRLTKANDGTPPGRQSFEAETGIRLGDWYGVYWARWGDAVAEAGFQPNERQGKFDRDTMLNLVALACRHFGKLPTEGELRLYRRTHPDFPSPSTIQNAFSPKTELIEALRIWTNERSGYSDVALMLPASIPEKPDRSREVLGSVYLLQSGSNYKIGRSDEIERRIREIRVALPDATILVHAITTDDPAGIEAYWHRRFADKRANGEWFKLTPSDVLAFKRRKFQ
ncbi:conserved protein of unknown function [Hyphomicrobium sp. MC1]|nr:conserved protein of unknown function [Hyphomicrobium sp. MC1]